jgi:hypothetical protein
VIKKINLLAELIFFFKKIKIEKYFSNDLSITITTFYCNYAKWTIMWMTLFNIKLAWFEVLLTWKASFIYDFIFY